MLNVGRSGNGEDEHFFITYKSFEHFFINCEAAGYNDEKIGKLSVI